MTSGFVLVVVDHDQKIFNIIGPVFDDDAWNARVLELQKCGRNVNCSSTAADLSAEQLAVTYSKQTGYAYSTIPIIDQLPTTGAAPYRGPLPDYANHANRNRVVKVLCKGSCARTSWAEMTVDYPGEQVLRRAQVFDFSARCLKCGHVANDAYNWYR